MNHRMRSLLILGLGLLLGISLALGRGVLAQREEAQAASPLPLEELRTFTEVFAKIKSDYVEPVEDKVLLESAVRGMLAGLDPHSSYLDSNAFKELQIGTTGEFGGLGLEVGMENGFVKVIAPIDDTPASRGGVHAGDLIIRLDDTPLQGMELNDAVKLMRGPEGSQITLTLLRKGEEKPLRITLTRAIIKVKSVKSQTLEPGFAYLRISQFQAQTGPNMIEAIDKLKKDSNGEMKGLVLDLRNNPGGVLNAAVAVSDAFLTKGLIVYTKGRVADSDMKLPATPNDYMYGAPIVVLVNGGSASASEIVAGALQDHQRAVVMGTKTFGKGSVQTIVPMSNNAALKITTARYYTPKGRSIQATGIVPDIRVEEAKITRSDKSEDDMLKEADLARHLDNTTLESPPPAPPAPTVEKAKKDVKPKFGALEEDYQMQEALNLLKGIVVFKQPTAEAK